MEAHHRVPLPPDPEKGTWRGRSVARITRSADGMVVLVGRSASDNDVLTLKLADPRDFWYHVAGESGSHVVVRNPDNLPRPPRETDRLAASLAAGYSKARGGGQVSVHAALCGDVSKPRGFPPGKVTLRRYRTLKVSPRRLDKS